MSNLYITEFARAGYSSVLPAHAPTSGNAPLPNSFKVPPLAEQKITVSGTTAKSAAFNAATKFIKVHCDGIASIAFGTTSITAAVTNQRIIAGVDYFFEVDPGGFMAAITNT